jgi:hypothetical protein
MKKKSLLEIIKLIPGKVIQNDFDLIDEDIALEDQKKELKEDMLQIELDDRLTLDIGWYSKPDGSGNFGLFIIEDEDWQNPILKIRSNSLKSLKRTIKTALKTLKR